MGRRQCLARLAALPLLLVGTAARARASEPIRLVTINNFTSKVNANVLKRVYARVGLELQVASMPPSRVTAMATQGLADGEVNRIRSYGDGYPTLIRVEPPFSIWTVSGFYKANAGLVVRSAADLASHDVGIVRGIQATAALAASSPHVHIAPSSKELVLMLDGGRFAVAIDGTDESGFFIRRLGLKGITTVELNRYPLYHYLHEKNKHLVPLISREIKKLADSGELKQLFELASAELIDSGEEP